MSGDMSDTLREHDQSLAWARVGFEVRCFVLGERNAEQRAKILASARHYDALVGRGRVVSRGSNAVQRVSKKLKQIKANDRAAWMRLADRWAEDTGRFYSLDLEVRRGAPPVVLEEEGYQLFRKILQDAVGVSADALLFFPDEYGRWSVGRDLSKKISAELSRRGWRSGHNRTHDRYAAILAPSHTLDLVWLGHYFLDAHNFTPDVMLGPEVWRLAASKKKVA